MISTLEDEERVLRIRCCRVLGGLELVECFFFFFEEESEVDGDRGGMR